MAGKRALCLEEGKQIAQELFAIHFNVLCARVFGFRNIFVIMERRQLFHYIYFDWYLTKIIVQSSTH